MESVSLRTDLRFGRHDAHLFIALYLSSPYFEVFSSSSAADWKIYLCQHDTARADVQLTALSGVLASFV